jgi:hypothetical protein
MTLAEVHERLRTDAKLREFAALNLFCCRSDLAGQDGLEQWLAMPAELHEHWEAEALAAHEEYMRADPFEREYWDNKARTKVIALALKWELEHSGPDAERKTRAVVQWVRERLSQVS